MAIQLPQGLQINAKQAVDIRLVMSKAMMLAQDDNLMPVKYLTICVDDGKLYLYDKNSEPNPETGKFKEILANVNKDVEGLEDQIDAFNDALSKKQDILHAGEGIEIVQDSSGDLIINSLINASSLAEYIPEALKIALENQEADSGLEVDSEGNIKVSLDSDFLEIDDDNKITLSDGILLQAIDSN